MWKACVPLIAATHMVCSMSSGTGVGVISPDAKNLYWQVGSNTSWTLTFVAHSGAQETISGSGNGTFDIPDGVQTCARLVQYQNMSGSATSTLTCQSVGSMDGGIVYGPITGANSSVDACCAP